MVSSMDTLPRSGLSGAAVNELREAILEGRLVQGERLSEVSLSSTLGVSRAPVREALLHLEQEGLVVSLPYKGASVVSLSQQDFLELSTLRIALEKLAWARAVERVSPEAVDDLNAIIAEMEFAVKSEQKAKLVRLDIDFHDRIFVLADHSRLYTAWTAIKWQVALFLLARRVRVDDYHSIIVQEHKALLDDILTAKTPSFEHLIEDHIGSGYGRLNTTAAPAS
ncbi:GntR family transcriptional regulator [Clavibacter michiganensis]|nr:GntR family transcriptional regulator [Clavibacter michiganensis]